MNANVYKEDAFEKAIVDEVLDNGWVRGLTKGGYRPDLGLDTGELDTFVGRTQKPALDKLVNAYGDLPTAQHELAKRVAAEIDKRGALDVLRNGVKDRGVTIQLCYFRPGHTLAAGALDEYRGNQLTVVRQLRYSDKSGDELDLALFVNGIPIATAELKNTLTGQDVEKAKQQYREDRDAKELIFARRTLVHFAVDPHLVFLTTRLAGKATRFLPFNVGSNGPGVSGGAGNPPAPADGYQTSYLWREVWQRDNFLELLQRFVHVAVPKKGKANPHTSPLIFPRYHQWHAVRRMTAHASCEGAGHNYLIEHSAGSGKSNTIAWLAHRLSTLHDADNKPVFDKAIVITDRVVLDRQLQDTIYQFDHVAGVVRKIDEDSQQLADALTGSAARVIITTLQKFPFVLDKVSKLGERRYAVIIDEAHSSQSGESASALKKALGRSGSDDIDDDGDLLTASALARGRHGNLSFFGFTATPKQKTLELFGTRNPDTDRDEPFHVYSMRQAIDEGFILDVLRNYITYEARWRLANAAVEATETADPEVDPKKAKAKLVRAAELHPESQDQRAQIIIEHFRNEVADRIGGRAKAMVVTRSREHALKLYQALRRYLDKRGITDCAPLVAFSGTLTLKDIDYTEPRLNGVSEAALPEAFAYTKVDDPQAAARNQTEYRILVVAEKYQTGFDQPLLAAMYVDKPLAGVAAVQTLSRLNRTHPDKTQDDVFVLDLANKAQDIQKAFKPYFETTITEPTDPNLLYDKQREVMDHQLLVESEMDSFAAALLTAESTGQLDGAHAELYRFLQPAVDRFTELAKQDRDRAEEFRSSINDYVRAYGFLAQVIGYADPDLERLYLYSRFLTRRLPREPGAGVDIGETTLSHLRINKLAEENLSLQPSGAHLIPGFSPDGGAAREVEEQPLSEVIEELNQRFGYDLSTSDQILLVQQIISLAEDENMQQVALNNDIARFGQVADPELDNIVARNHDRNTTFVGRYFDNPEFQAAVKQEARRRAYDLILSPSRTEALRKLRTQVARDAVEG
ncbi:type I restriction endonuclease subunit R [Phytohabitans aurantiacus]|uniref:Type I restriction endonuclease subunit R n=1 Tax=Phytohabitans aurantiacus TaxID=3016789 RepID=A0ABQ5QZS8_9ACTN|nr:DEAD/DEAH box helicase family protein [Phytohabitans aurantiacus]GLH99797.1 type I restriction endonuclease subunit R [Phytohabitans aurantiacus]